MDATPRTARLWAACLFAAFLFFNTAPPAAAQDAASDTSVSDTSALPPLIDRDLFFGDPEVTSAQLSPDGEQIAFIKPYRGARNVYVKGIDEPFEAARPVTADDRPVPGYFWSQDGQYILYVQDKGGNENFHVYAVDPSAEAVDSTGVPPARDLTPVEGVRAIIYAVPEETPGEMIVGLNDRDAAYHDVYRVDIATGERELMIENTQNVGGYVFDQEGDARLAIRQTDGGGTELLRIQPDSSLTPVYTCTYEEECYPIRFHAGGERVYLVSNKGDDVDLQRLLLFDPESGEVEEVVASDPENEVDFGGAVFSEDTDSLLATYYVGDRLRIYPKDEQFAEDLETLREQLPDGDFYITSSTEDMRLHTVSVSSDVDPGSVYLYDRETGEVELLYRSRPELPREHLAEMRPIRYTARDGMEIPAYLTLPKGVEPENLPVVIFPHGGPWSRDTWGYDAYAQFLANRGYAVLQPNFRSSTGYGQAFLNAGNKEWGTGAMQHDITDGVQYLIDEGIADSTRIGIFGGSYGGYATLAGVTYTPELYAAAVPYVAPSNLVTLIESFPAYWRPFLEGTWFQRVGDPEDPEDREDLLARSPLTKADVIETPLLVVHGANDPRVKQRESDQLVVALRERGVEVEYLVAPDEGHGFRAPENRMALAVAMEEFLAEHLGGRYQEAVPDSIAERLEEITVDPATVTLPDTSANAEAAEAQTAPLPDADGAAIEPMTLAYNGTLSMQGREIEMDLQRIIEAGDEGTWRILDLAEMPMGSTADTFVVAQETLKPIRRSMSAMGATMRFAYADSAVTGQMGAAGQMTDVDVALDAPVLGDGASQELFIAGLPLEEGYSTTLRTFNAQTQKAQPVKLEVTSTATTEVPAGTYETYVVELTPLDESGSATTLYVLQDAPHYAVKGEYQLPAQMGGGTMTTELVTMEEGSAGDGSSR